VCVVLLSGFAIAFAIPEALVPGFIKFAEHIGRIRNDAYVPALPGWLTGMFERAFAFALVVAVRDAALIVTILIAWMAAKLASNWHRGDRPDQNEQQDRWLRGRSLIAIMAGIMSLACAVVGAYISRDEIISPATYERLFPSVSAGGVSPANTRP